MGRPLQPWPSRSLFLFVLSATFHTFHTVCPTAPEDHNQDGKLTFEEALMLLKHSGGIDVLWVENESYHRKQEL